jgi:hypothetical protein
MDKWTAIASPEHPCCYAAALWCGDRQVADICDMQTARMIAAAMNAYEAVEPAPKVVKVREVPKVCGAD